MSFKPRHEMPEGSLEVLKALEMEKNNAKIWFSKTETWVNQTTATGVIIQRFHAMGWEVVFLYVALIQVEF